MGMKDGGYNMDIDSGNIEDFEILVDELVKPHPDETHVRQSMEKLGLSYTCDHVERISMVLEKMNKMVFAKEQRKDNDDLSKHP